jgi:UDP-N-acetylglucosamine 1-carboxyvinyltransferase
MLRIQGPQTVSGAIQISGSKNAALPLIAASLYFEESTLTNVPRIGDVFTFLTIIESLGVKVHFEGNTLTMNTKDMSLDNLDRVLIKKIRVGIFLIPVLLERFGSIEIPYPGGCNIGKRPIDDHIRGFQAMGYQYEGQDDIVQFSGTPLQTAIELSAGFAVTATENMIIANAFRSGKTTIKLAAIEPHVLNLIDYLKNA